MFSIMRLCVWLRGPFAAIGAVASVLAILEWVGLRFSFGAEYGTLLVLVAAALAFLGDGFYIAKFLIRRVEVTLDSGHVLRIEYGNVFDQDGLVVIPVNDCFDTELGECKVSKKSVHGQLLLRLKEDTRNLLDGEIADALKSFGCTSVKRKYGGKSAAYEIGTVASVALSALNGDRRYLLVASTKTCEKDDAIVCNAEFVRRAIDGVLDYAHKHGAGRPIVFPLIGSGHAQTGMTRKRILMLMIMTIAEYVRKNGLNSDAAILLYGSRRDDIDLGVFQEFWKGELR